jgi:ABC-type Fe3+/spermidine/putrescine transport system ATPase subunit
VRSAAASGDASRVVVTTDIGEICCASAESDERVGETVTITLRPEKVTIVDVDAGSRDGWNTVRGVVTQAAFLGAQNEYRVRLDSQSARSQEITVRQQNLGATTDASSGDTFGTATTDRWRAFGPGERVALTWRHEVSLVLHDAGENTAAGESMSVQAPAHHASHV